jgi:hypothetical protein
VEILLQHVYREERFHLPSKAQAKFIKSWDDLHDPLLRPRVSEPRSNTKATAVPHVPHDGKELGPSPQSTVLPTSDLDLGVQLDSISDTGFLLPQCHDNAKTCVMCNIGESTIRIEVGILSISLHSFHNFFLYTVLIMSIWSVVEHLTQSWHVCIGLWP